MLPDQSLPEVEQALVEHLAEKQCFDTSGNLASLIHRYATEAVEPQVVTILDRNLGKGDCVTQERLLAYLLKVDPASARSRLEAAMAARGDGFSACNHALLPQVGQLQNHPLLQDLAIKSLEDPDPEIVASAAAYLQSFGSAAVEDALWSHFIKWSAQWHGKESSLRYVPGEADSNLYEAGAGQNMLMALATGQGWLTNEDKLHRLVQLSVGPQEMQQAEQYLQLWEDRPWRINYMSGDR